MRLADVLTLAWKLAAALEIVKDLRPGDRGELPLIRSRIGKRKWRLGPIPVAPEE